MGPSLQPEEPGISRVDRIRYTIRKATNEYFKNPIHYLFYTFLAFTMFGLGLFKTNFPWQYYAILGLIFGIEIYKEYFGKKDNERT